MEEKARAMMANARHVAVVFGALLILSVSLHMMSGGGPRIFLIGDSTMADKPLTDNPERGWGQLLPQFFTPAVEIKNFARNGRSTKSFITQGLWQNVCDQLRSGDYLFIQFGHNDQKKEDTSRYADAQTSYKNNLQLFIRAAKDKGAIPVLLTPVNRRKFNKTGMLVDTHTDYPAVVRDVARAEQIPLIDLHKKSFDVFQKEGVEGTKKIFLWTKPGEYRSKPEGTEDNTHFGRYGAALVAGLVVEGIRELNLPLVSWLTASEQKVLPGAERKVGLDYYFNNETRVRKGSSTPEPFHYVWEDTTFSGFSELGRQLFALGAEIDSLHAAPTPASLRRLSMYLIVDPDIPTENPQPHYVDDAAISAITAWVENGGVLVLMGNDKGNAEFEHFNHLAEKFGIHFNEDSHHRVTGTNFEQGAVAQFPAHPVFNGVKKIYIKELSSLTLEKPAVPLLTENEIVVMATARFGKGMVFAIGDPWLYNEYYDNRKLPEGFENFKAAKNLFRWLLEQSAPVGMP
ncbi:MAG: GDSL-type esterase/lipase family protein [Ignavibacteriales bacterium]|nr:GDSL-type esterase/lipase family protein [Ignavibacteriales bacterium]